MARRAEYIRVYRALHSLQPGFERVTELPRYSYLLPEGHRPQTPMSEDREQHGEDGPAAAASAARDSMPTTPPPHLHPDGRLSSIVDCEPSPAATSDSAGTPAHANGSLSNGQPQLQRAVEQGHSGSEKEDVEGPPRPKLPFQKRAYARPSTGPRGAAELAAKLARLEAQLTLGQVMCYRAFVALWHSSQLRKNSDAWLRWREAMGVITNFVDAIPTTELDDEEDGPEQPPQQQAAGVPAAHLPSGLAGGGLPQAAGVQEGSLGKGQQQQQQQQHRKASMHSVLSLRVTCPRAGIKLVNRITAMDETAVENFLSACGPAWEKSLRSAMGYGAYAPGGPRAERRADVLALMVEGITFTMPTAHHLTLEASSGYLHMHLIDGAAAMHNTRYSLRWLLHDDGTAFVGNLTCCLCALRRP